jgi:hypothetical protein
MVPGSADGGSSRRRGLGPEDAVSLLGCRQNTAGFPTIWPLLIVAGLLTVPAECVRIGHPHSLYQSASAAPAPAAAHAHGEPHSAADHAHAGSGYLPAWASPMEVIAPPMERSATRSQPHPAHPGTGMVTSTPSPTQAATAGDLPVVEPAAPTVTAAFGTALALIAALILVLLPGLPRATGTIALLSGLLARALDPPPPRALSVAR